MIFFVFFFSQKTAYEMRISYWSSDVCSSDLPDQADRIAAPRGTDLSRQSETADIPRHARTGRRKDADGLWQRPDARTGGVDRADRRRPLADGAGGARLSLLARRARVGTGRSEERRVGKEWGRPFNSRG